MSVVRDMYWGSFSLEVGFRQFCKTDIINASPSTIPVRLYRCLDFCSSFSATKSVCTVLVAVTSSPFLTISYSHSDFYPEGQIQVGQGHFHKM